MSLKDALNSTTRTGRRERCRVCVLIDTLPEPDASDLAAASLRDSGFSLRQLTEALAAEGHAGMHYSLKHHRYICGARP